MVGAYFEVQPQDAPRLNLFAKEDRCVSPNIIAKNITNGIMRLARPALNLLAKYLPASRCEARRAGGIIPLRQIDFA